MSEHRHRCKCDSCCGDLFSCGDQIEVIFILDPTLTPIQGTYISSSCDRLIWRRSAPAAGNLECTPCEVISIRKLNP